MEKEEKSGKLVWAEKRKREREHQQPSQADSGGEELEERKNKKKEREKAARSRCLWRTFNKTGTRLFFTKKIRGNYRIAHPVQKLSDRFHAPSTEVSPLPRDQSRWSPENPAGKIRANWRCRWPSKWESAARPSRSPLWLLVVKGGGGSNLAFIQEQFNLPSGNVPNYLV